MNSCNYKRILLFFSVLIIFKIGFGQSLSVAVNNTNFNVSTSNQITSGSINTSAFSISLNSRRDRYHLVAAVTSMSFNPSGTTFPSIPLSVQLRSYSGSNPSGQVNGVIQLTENPPGFASLSNNSAFTGNAGTAVWTYDLILSPIGYSIPPGTYIFTVTVRMIATDNSFTREGTFSITLNVQSVLGISLLQNSPTNISFNASSDYINGITLSNFHTLQMMGNVNWLTSVAAQSPVFTTSTQDGSTNMPCSIMAIRANGGGSFLPISTTPTTLNTGLPGDASRPGNTVNYDMNFNPGYIYNPGIYSISLLYTTTNQ